MRKRVFFPLALLILITLQGCTPTDSLNPIYTSKNIVEDKALAGVWVAPKSDDKGSLEITEIRYCNEGFSSCNEGYSIRMNDADGTFVRFDAYLVEIDGRRFLDVVPEEWSIEKGSYPLHLKASKLGTAVEPQILRLGMAAYMEFTGAAGSSGEGLSAQTRHAHWFLKVKLLGNKLQLDYLDDEDFRKTIEQRKDLLASVLLGEGKYKSVVITASTSDLQKFMTEHYNDDKIFTGHFDELVRKDQPASAHH